MARQERPAHRLEPSSARQLTFQTERRIARGDALVPACFGGGLVAIAITVRCVSGKWDLIQIGFMIVAIIVWGLSFRLYRSSGELVIRIVGDAHCLRLVRPNGTVTIRLADISEVKYSQDDSGSCTRFSLTSGNAEYVRNELPWHEPMLAFVRGVYTGPMIYRRKPITKPEEVPRVQIAKGERRT